MNYGRFDIALGHKPSKPKKAGAKSAPTPPTSGSSTDFIERLTRERSSPEVYRQEYLGNWNVSDHQPHPDTRDVRQQGLEATLTIYQINAFRLLESFVSNGYPYQEQYERLRPLDIHFRKEFLTMRVSMPRRCGNTTVALMLLNRFPSSIISVINRNMLDPYQRRLDLSRIVNLSSYGSGHGRTTQVAICDGAPFLDRRQEETFYMIQADSYLLLG